jgi:hypothetical protein
MGWGGFQVTLAVCRTGSEKGSGSDFPWFLRVGSSIEGFWVMTDEIDSKADISNRNRGYIRGWYLDAAFWFRLTIPLLIKNLDNDLFPIVQNCTCFWVAFVEFASPGKASRHDHKR